MGPMDTAADPRHRWPMSSLVCPSSPGEFGIGARLRGVSAASWWVLPLSCRACTGDPMQAKNRPPAEGDSTIDCSGFRIRSRTTQYSLLCARPEYRVTTQVPAHHVSFTRQRLTERKLYSAQHRGLAVLQVCLRIALPPHRANHCRKTGESSTPATHPRLHLEAEHRPTGHTT